MTTRMISFVPSRIWWHPRVSRTMPLQRVIPQIAVAAMQLQRLVTDIEADIGSEALSPWRNRAWLPGLLHPVRRRLSDHQPRRLQLRRHVGELELQRLELSQGLPNCLRSAYPARVPAPRAPPDGTGADIQAPAIKAHHRDLEPVALIADKIFHRHPAIIEEHLRRRLASSSPSCVPAPRSSCPGASFGTAIQLMPLRRRHRRCGPCSHTHPPCRRRK